jgi:hypothetical protein
MNNSIARIFIKTVDGRSVPFGVDLTTITVRNLKERIQQVDGTFVLHQRLIYDGDEMEDDLSLSDYNLYNGASIDLVLRLVGGKPVIYLLAPESLEALVELSLVPQWSLSAIYPVTPIKSGPAGTGVSHGKYAFTRKGT